VNYSKSDPSFLEHFNKTRDQIAYLDDLDDILKFPQFVDDEMLEGYPSASSIYLDGPFSSEPEGEDETIPIIALANRACGIWENSQDYNWANIRQISALGGNSGLRPSATSTLGWLDPSKPELHLHIRSMIYDLMALLAHGVPISQLWVQAIAGDLEAVFRLVRIDKSAVTTPEIGQFIRARQFDADWGFFEELARALGKPPISQRDYKPTAIILTAYYWNEEFCQWSHDDLVGFLVENDVLPKVIGKHESFIRTINNLGLNKKRGRPKKRN